MEQLSSEQSNAITVPNPSPRHVLATDSDTHFGVERACPEPVEGEERSSGRGVHISPKQLEANRKNAQLSTGPKTVRGKSVSAKNAVTHALWAKEVVVAHKKAGEDPVAFADLHCRLIRNLKPHGALEEMLVERIAVSYWRLRRCLRAENGAIVRNLVMAENDDLSMFAHPQKSASSHTNGEYMTSLLPDGKSMAVDRLMRYELYIQKQLDRALVQLERAQGFRNGENIPAPVEILQT